MSGRAWALLAIVAIAVGALAAACSDDNASGDAQAVVTEPAAGTSTPAPDIRDEDLTQQPGLQEFLTDAGGIVEANLIVYVDLTEDGVEDAVVPVSGGGEGGDIAVFVYGYSQGGLAELLRVLPQDSVLSATIEEGALNVSEPVYAEGDPLCCPSELKKTAYGWDGSQLTVKSEVTEQQSPPKD